MVKTAAGFGFGDYVEIEQKRHGVPNEMYRYKVIRSLRSTSYVDVPVLWSSKEENHDELVPVLACICCGVQEKEVLNFRFEDVKALDLPQAPETTEILNEVKADKGILTEEELKEIEEYLSKFGHISFQDACKLRTSHRHLLSANAELSFKNMNLQNLITDLNHYAKLEQEDNASLKEKIESLEGLK